MKYNLQCTFLIFITVIHSKFKLISMKLIVVPIHLFLFLSHM